MSLLSWITGLFSRTPRTVAGGTVSGTPPCAGPVSHVFVVDPDVKLAASDQPFAIAAGLQAHMREDLAPAWGTNPLDVVRGDATPPGDAEVQIQVHEEAPTDPKLQGALAVHLTNGKGVPIIHAWASLLRQYGVSLSSVVCHELDEARVDPQGDRTIVLPDGRKAALEIDDAVEALSYRKLGVECSNFNLPSNFGIGGSAPPYDFLGKVSRQFEVLEGGYAQVLTPGGWQQLSPDRTAEGTVAPATGLGAYHAHLNRLSEEHGVPYTRKARRAHKLAAKRSLWQRFTAWLHGAPAPATYALPDAQVLPAAA